MKAILELKEKEVKAKATRAERVEASKQAWTTYKADVAAAKQVLADAYKTLLAEKKAAIEQFNTARKACVNTTATTTAN